MNGELGSGVESFRFSEVFFVIYKCEVVGFAEFLEFFKRSICGFIIYYYQLEMCGGIGFINALDGQFDTFTVIVARNED